MKRSCIVTFHRAVNYGAVLQSFALVFAIRNKLGGYCEILDYRSRFIERYYNPLYLLLPSNWKRLASYIIYNGVLFPQREKMVSFLNNKGCISKETYRTKNELEASLFKYDNFIAGSDQVWSPFAAGFDSVYFLSFVPSTKRKSSYAASIGLAELPANTYEIYHQRLTGFSNYSMRELSGKNIVEKMFPDNIVRVNLDPTLLLSDLEWSSNIDGKAIRNSIKERDGYVLIYCISEHDGLFELARTVANNHLKICYINNRWRKRKGVENNSGCTIDEWLYLFKNASYIVTDSFHGTAFSINYKKQFFVFQEPKNKRVTRIQSLLEQLDIKNRIFQSPIVPSDIQDINYTQVSEKLSALRDDSLDTLRNIIKE